MFRLILSLIAGFDCGAYSENSALCRRVCVCSLSSRLLRRTVLGSSCPSGRGCFFRLGGTFRTTGSFRGMALAWQDLKLTDKPRSEMVLDGPCHAGLSSVRSHIDPFQDT